MFDRLSRPTTRCASAPEAPPAIDPDDLLEETYRRPHLRPAPHFGVMRSSMFHVLLERLVVSGVARGSRSQSLGALSRLSTARPRPSARVRGDVVVASRDREATSAPSEAQSACSPRRGASATAIRDDVGERVEEVVEPSFLSSGASWQAVTRRAHRQNMLKRIVKTGAGGV